jgi:hypothetical protein
MRNRLQIALNTKLGILSLKKEISQEEAAHQEEEEAAHQEEEAAHQEEAFKNLYL